MMDSFGARATLELGGSDYEIFRLDAVTDGHVGRLPYSLKILLENLLRHEDGRDVTRDDILALANWDPQAAPSTEISFTPSRVILQDFTGVPAVVDLAAMRVATMTAPGMWPSAYSAKVRTSTMVAEWSIRTLCSSAVEIFGVAAPLSSNTPS